MFSYILKEQVNTLKLKVFTFILSILGGKCSRHLVKWNIDSLKLESFEGFGWSLFTIPQNEIRLVISNLESLYTGEPSIY